MTISPQELRFRIIKKLVRHRVWGVHHIDQNNLPKGMPPELRKNIMEEIDTMVKEGLIVRISHTGGKHVYLNYNFRSYFEKIIREHQ